MQRDPFECARRSLRAFLLKEGLSAADFARRVKQEAADEEMRDAPHRPPTRLVTRWLSTSRPNRAYATLIERATNGAVMREAWGWPAVGERSGLDAETG